MINFLCMLRSRHVSCRPVSPQATKLSFRLQAQHACRPKWAQRENLGSCPEATSPQCYFFGTSTQPELCNCLEITVISAKTISGTTPDSNTKILRSMPLMRWLQLDSMIATICRSSHAARSSPRSKHYNAPTSM